MGWPWEQTEPQRRRQGRAGQTFRRPWIEPIEGLIRQLSNPPERMVRRDPILDRDVGEQGAAALLLTSHRRQVLVKRQGHTNRYNRCSITSGVIGGISIT
jgi:hypothetical protein